MTELVERLLIERIGETFDGECHLTEEEAHRIFAKIEHQADTIARLREVLTTIAHAIRLGPETDVVSWRSLANACQSAARAALTDRRN